MSLMASVTILFFHVSFSQTYVVRILRESQNEPHFVFRTFDEFQELHNKLSIMFPLWKIPGFVALYHATPFYLYIFYVHYLF